MNETVLSICSTCRDGDENLKKSGGQLLLENIIAYFNYKKLPFLKLREVRCMSQCKRSCVIPFTSNNCFHTCSVLLILKIRNILDLYLICSFHMGKLKKVF